MKRIGRVAEGDPQYRGDIVQYMTKIWQIWFQKLVNTVVEKTTSGHSAPRISLPQIQMVLMVHLVKNDFQSKSVRESLLEYTGLEEYEGYEKHDTIPPLKSVVHFKSAMPNIKYWYHVYQRSGNHLKKIVKDPEMSLIYKLFLLFKDLPQFKQIYMVLERILRFKIEGDEDFNCYENASEVINTSYESLMDLGRALQVIWSESDLN